MTDLDFVRLIVPEQQPLKPRKEEKLIELFPEKPSNYCELNKTFWNLDQKCMSQEGGYTKTT